MFTRVRRVRDFGALGGGAGGFRLDGSFPEIVCERATVVYPTACVVRVSLVQGAAWGAMTYTLLGKKEYWRYLGRFPHMGH